MFNITNKGGRDKKKKKKKRMIWLEMDQNTMLIVLVVLRYIHLKLRPGTITQSTSGKKKMMVQFATV